MPRYSNTLQQCAQCGATIPPGEPCTWTRSQPVAYTCGECLGVEHIATHRGELSRQLAQNAQRLEAALDRLEELLGGDYA